MNYWVIKARPDRNDFSKFPARGRLGRWYTAHLGKGWAPGDILFIWATTPMLRIIGIAELTKPNDGFDSGKWHFGVRYLTNPFEGPGIADLRRQPSLKSASFLKSGPAGTVFSLTPRQGAFLQLLTDPAIPAKLVPSPVSPNEESLLARRIGGGFGTTEENKRVEKAAIRAATRELRDEGWKVRSVEAQKLGYDLHCLLNGKSRKVEVKGVRGALPRFILTAREYRRSRTDTAFGLCLVTSALAHPVVQFFDQAALRLRLSITPLAFLARIEP